MSKALSLDLRTRVFAAVADGLSHRHAGVRFGVSAASVSRWRAREREQGEPRPKALGGDRRSGRVDACTALILSLLEETPDITLEEMRQARQARPPLRLRDDPALFRTPCHHSKKKTLHASEQDRPDILKQRQDWFEGQLDLDPTKLVFIDETWAKTNMVRTHGRAPRGERLRAGAPHGHWRTTTFIGALTLRGMVAPFVLNGPINRTAFEAYVEQVLVPELRPATSSSWTISPAARECRPER